MDVHIITLDSYILFDNRFSFLRMAEELQIRFVVLYNENLQLHSNNSHATTLN
jgi:hypothetical protein